jgi:hypothetical protein
MLDASPGREGVAATPARTTDVFSVERWRGQSLLVGTVAGIVGGLVFGLLMTIMMPPVMAMIGSLVGAPRLGWGVHLVFSALIGAGFGLVFGRLVAGWGVALGLGLAYGFAWWILGPLLIMPTWLGMGPAVGAALQLPNLLSLAGHLVFGVVTGLVYLAITRSAPAGPSAGAQ